MQTSEFIRKIKDRTGTEDDEQVYQYIRGVFSVLRDRISIGGAHNLATQLPKELRDIWESGFVHDVLQAVKGTEHKGLETFIGHVQNAAHLGNADEAERITRAVFATLKEQISKGEIHSIANQLPEDLRRLWMESTPEEGYYTSKRIGPAAAEVFRTDHQLEEEVEYLLELNDEVDESTINVHVEQGQVHLSGVVKSEQEREAAAKSAKHVLGVTEVINDLSVEI
jgi:uncharacterized protein (DUF2267 family)